MPTIREHRFIMPKLVSRYNITSPQHTKPCAKNNNLQLQALYPVINAQVQQGDNDPTGTSSLTPG